MISGSTYEPASERFRRIGYGEDYFRDLTSRLEVPAGRAIAESPLLQAKHLLSCYLYNLLRDLFRDQRDLDDVRIFMETLLNDANPLSEEASPQAEVVALEFREKVLGKLSDFHPADGPFMLENLDRHRERLRSVHSRIHPLSRAVQRHFYFTVGLAEKSRVQLLEMAFEWNGDEERPASVSAASEARDRLYLDFSLENYEAYFAAVEKVTRESYYDLWLSRLESAPALAGLREANQKRTDELLTEVLWRHHTAE